MFNVKSSLSCLHSLRTKQATTKKSLKFKEKHKKKEIANFHSPRLGNLFVFLLSI